MRKKRLVIAMMLALTAVGSAQAADSFDEALTTAAKGPLERYPKAEVPPTVKAIATTKRGVLAGHLHEEAELAELRLLLREHETSKRSERVIEDQFPLEPDQIKDLRRRLADIEKANNEPVLGETNFRIRNTTYNPDSNEPMVISVAGGYSSQVEFYDSSGKPWPIRREGVIGDSESFTKQVLGEDRHIASFVLSRNYKETNAAVVLDGLSATIPILLKGTRTTVDGRVTVTIPRLGPNAAIQPVFEHEIKNVSPDLVQLQGGNAPVGAKTLRVAGVPNAEAWFDGQYVYLSLPGRLMLPPPLSSSMTPMGKHLYKLAPTPYITVAVNGERKGATLEGMYQTDIRRAPTVFDQESAK